MGHQYDNSDIGLHPEQQDVHKQHILKAYQYSNPKMFIVLA
ncbi:protein of unknown function (plasmid) [Vibrio harveyi]|nr:protein of unknown function [Vibrio harveyi]